MEAKKPQTKGIRLSSNDKLVFIGNLGTMLSAGISIVEAVDSLREDARGGLHTFLTILKKDLEQGKQVHESLEGFPGIFDRVNVNIIKAAEQSGTLDQALKDMRTTLMKDIEFRDKITSAMTYPTFIFIVFAFVLLGMLLGIVPRIGGVFRSLNIPLPLPTQILLGLSDFLVKNKLSVGMIVVLISLFVIWLYKRHRNTLLSVIFRLPVVQDLVRDVDLTRFTRGLSLLLVSGIPISGALELTRDLVIKPEVRKAIEEGYQAVLQGKPLSQGLGKRGRLFPGILKKMIEVGERSGTLDKSLQEASEFLDYQTSKQVKTFTTLLEPIMLVFVAILVGGMMLAIVAPIYGLIGSINARR